MAQESIQSLLDEIKLALAGMSYRNPNRRLLMKCAAALASLAGQLHQAKTAPAVEPWYRRLWSRVRSLYASGA